MGICMDITCLREAGLTDGEIKVYLALLELGSSTTGPVVEKSGISRSIIYQILDKLLHKGLVSFIIKEKVKYFQAAQSSKIIGYVNEREMNLLENKKKIEDLLPQLLLKQNLSPKSEANIYSGFKGIRTAHEHMYEKLKKCEEYYALGIPAYQPKEQHNYWQKDHAVRVRLGIKCKLLFNKDTEKSILEKRNKFKDTSVRYMPTDIKTPALFEIYKDTTIIILQHPTELAVEIVNQEIANSFQSYFDEFWKRSKPFRK